MMKYVLLTGAVLLLIALAAGIWYYKTQFYVPDRDGMIGHATAQQTTLSPESNGNDTEDI